MVMRRVRGWSDVWVDGRLACGLSLSSALLPPGVLVVSSYGAQPCAGFWKHQPDQVLPP